jgi:amidase
MSAVALRAAIAARKVSSREVMGAYLGQIDALNPRVNAIVALQDPDALMKEAGALDEEAARGALRGPLHGFPHAPKDLQPVRGIKSTSGSPLYRDVVPTQDSLMVERLRHAGAIFIGKTNTPEFGLGSHTYNPVYGATGNAFDPSLSAGGSSGGAAVALALRLAPLADGSDYGGSLRNPAGWNNVFGFRTSYGVAPVEGPDVWLPSMSVVGPMARSVPDLALLLSVQAGFDPRAPLSVSGSGDRFAAPLRKPVKGKRVGWLGDFNGAVPYDPEVLDVCRKALKTFEALGCVVDQAAPDYGVDAAWDAFIRLRWWQTGGGLSADWRVPSRRAQMKPEAQWEAEHGATLSAYDVTAASVVRTAWSNAVARLFERFDYLVAPTAQVFPFPIKETWPKTVGGAPMRTYHEWMKGVCLVTMTGCPSLAVPAGFGRAGLPMGMQIIAPVRQDEACLTLALAYDEISQWTAARQPPLLVA